MTVLEDINDLISQLHDRRERKVSELRRSSTGQAMKAISHTVPFDAVALTQSALNLLDTVEDAELRVALTVDVGDAAAAALAQAGHQVASGQMALLAVSARQALAQAGVTFVERKKR